MASVIGDLLVRIGADSEGLDKGLTASRKKLKQWQKEAKQGTETLVKFGAAATAAGTALSIGLGVRAVETGKELSNLSRLSNTSAEGFQNLAFAARSVQVEQDKLGDILKDVNDRVGDFVTTGGGPMASFFEKVGPLVGVTAENFRNLSGPQSLQLYVSSLQKANLSQAEMVFYMEAMASDATALLPLLRDGGEALAKQAEEAKALGVILTDLDVQKLAIMAEGMDKSLDVLTSFTEKVTAEMTPALTVVNDKFLDMVKSLGGVDNAAEATANVMSEVMAFILNAIDGVDRTIEVLGKSIAVMFLGMKGQAIAFAQSIVNGPVLAINGLIDLINEFTGSEIEKFSMSGLAVSLGEEFALTQAAVTQGMADIQETLMQPLAGDTFEQLVLQQREALEVMAEDRALANENQITQQADHDALLNDMIRDGNEIRLDMAAKAAAAEEQVQKNKAKGREDAEKKMYGDLKTLMGSESRKMFEIGKIAAIAETIMSTYEGAQKQFAALSSNPPLAYAAAGAAIAAGFVRVNAIRATQFGSKSAGGVAAGGSAVAGGAGVPSGGDNGSAGGGSGGQNIFLQGLDRDQLFSGGDIVDLINMAQEQGARLVLVD